MVSLYLPAAESIAVGMGCSAGGLVRDASCCSAASQQLILERDSWNGDFLIFIFKKELADMCNILGVGKDE